MAKDNFSKQAHLYAQFRPTYPQELYDFLWKNMSQFETAWDCATGNGQVAKELSYHFKEVWASDISQKQLAHAAIADNIHYVLAPAEQVPLPDQSVDLITVGQALHWFDFEAFFREVKRVAKPHALFAAWGYGSLQVKNPVIQEAIDRFYTHEIGAYWDDERRHIDDHFAQIPIPFVLETKFFQMPYTWNYEQLEGYLNTWSSVQKYIQIHQKNPVDKLLQQLKEQCPIDNFDLYFPIFVKAGKVQ